jgi:hypothetical protein
MRSAKALSFKASIVVHLTLEHVSSGFVQKVKIHLHCDAVSQHGRSLLSDPNMSKIRLLKLIIVGTHLSRPAAQINKQENNSYSFLVLF